MSAWPATPFSDEASCSYQLADSWCPIAPMRALTGTHRTVLTQFFSCSMTHGGFLIQSSTHNISSVGASYIHTISHSLVAPQVQRERQPDVPVGLLLSLTTEGGAQKAAAAIVRALLLPDSPGSLNLTLSLVSHPLSAHTLTMYSLCCA